MALAFTPSPVFVYPFSERASMNSLGATITIGDWFDLRTVPKNGREVLFHLAGKNKKTPVFGA
jgi:hypothetical protein